MHKCLPARGANRDDIDGGIRQNRLEPMVMKASLAPALRAQTRADFEIARPDRDEIRSFTALISLGVLARHSHTAPEIAAPKIFWLMLGISSKHAALH